MNVIVFSSFTLLLIVQISGRTFDKLPRYYPGQLVEIVDGPFINKLAYYSHVNPNNTVRIFVDIPIEKNGKLGFKTEEISVDFIIPARQYNEGIDELVRK